MVRTYRLTQPPQAVNSGLSRFGAAGNLSPHFQDPPPMQMNPSKSMKLLRFITPLAILLLAAAPSPAQLVIPGADGSDGALNITTNTVIDLSQALTTNWNADNTGNAGGGVYDSNQWAVVYKYSSVNVAAGATVTFNNHSSRAPVVWLVSGDVTINGTVILDGGNWVPAPGLSEPGPGGFRGGCGYYTAGVANGPGFGPGGGYAGSVGYCCGGYHGPAGGGASYGSVGENVSGNFPVAPVYGNPSLVPLIGGSGGGGGIVDGVGASGGAGGGAILIACGGTLTLSGIIQANGGLGNSRNYGGNYGSGDGSGGGIRLVAQALVGTGSILALGGNDTIFGGLGRIRIERVVNTNSIRVTPDPSVVSLTPGSTALIWPPTNAPTIKIVSIGTQHAPTDPLTAFGTQGADIVQPLTNSIPVVIETTNVEQASQVSVIVTPRSNGGATTVNASVTSVVNSNPLTLLWTANMPVNLGYSAIQVQVVRP